MRSISEIIIHCTATPEGRDYTVDSIRRWHKNRGFSDIGYHYVIHPDGRVEPGRPIEVMGAHCQGHNEHSVGIAYIGGTNAKGRPKKTITAAQEASLVLLCKQLAERFPALREGAKAPVSSTSVADLQLKPPVMGYGLSVMEQGGPCRLNIHGHTLAQSERSSQAGLDNAESKQGHGSEYSLNIHGHNEYSLKRCPCFDVQEERVKWGI